jgi:hypothetical protein
VFENRDPRVFDCFGNDGIIEPTANEMPDRRNGAEIGTAPNNHSPVCVNTNRRIEDVDIERRSRLASRKDAESDVRGAKVDAERAARPRF